MHIFITLKAKNTADAKAAEQQMQLEIQQDWDKGFKHYKRALVVLRDLLIEAKPSGDGIVQTDGYVDCIPSSINPQIAEVRAGTIGLQNNTKVSFSIKISGLNEVGHRQMHILCTAGDLELYPDPGGDFHALLNIYNVVSRNDQVTGDKADGLISDDITSLVGAQFLLLNSTNK